MIYHTAFLMHFDYYAVSLAALYLIDWCLFSAHLVASAPAAGADSDADWRTVAEIFRR